MKEGKTMQRDRTRQPHRKALLRTRRLDRAAKMAARALALHVAFY